MWIDCHAHLDRLPEKELNRTVADAEAAGVSIILSSATDLLSSASVVRHCKEFASVYGAVGISPCGALSLPDGWEERLRTYLDERKIVALGEIGIDRTNSKYPPFEDQLPLFERQLRIARKHGLPVVVHSRGAEREAAEICRSSGVQQAVFHCFTGSRKDMEYIIASGYHISFSGIVTFDAALGELAKNVPAGRIFIETDSPYLAPFPHRGKTNRPAWVALVGETVARCRGVPPESLQVSLEENFRHVFLS